MENVQAAVNQQVERTHKILSIGRVWDNSATATGRQPTMRIILDRQLGLNIVLAPSSELLLFPNAKREGKKDADFRVAVSLPAAVVEAEITRQRAGRRGTPVAVAA
mgnify:FL=1